MAAPFARYRGRVAWHHCIMMRCYDAAMRTTIDLPEDLHRIVSSLATHGRRSLSATATELIRRGLAAEAAGPATATRRPAFDPLTGLPTVHLPRTVTPEDVHALDDEA